MPTYSLKANATTAAAALVFVADNGLANLVSGGAAVTAVGTVTTSTYGGHPVYGDSAAAGNHLQATLAAGIVANQKFAVLWMGHFGISANNELRLVLAPNATTFGTKYTAPGPYMHSTLNLIGGDAGQQISGYVHPNSTVYTMIQGREADGAIKDYVNGVGSVAYAGNASSLGSTIPAGDWKFGGAPFATAGAGPFGIQVFAVFIGIGPDELATYLGSDPYAALFDVVAAPSVAFTGTVPAQTGVTGTASTALALSGYFSGGTAPYTYAVQAGTLPAGLSLNASTGAITGTPTSAGSYAATIRATDAGATTADTNSIGWTITAPAATATTLSGPTGGQVAVASAPFTVGANGAITGTVTVTPSDGGGGGAFSPTSVAISAGTPTATFTYTPASSGAKTISISDTGSLTDAASLTYTASALAAMLTSSPLKNNTGTLLTSAACEAYVSNPSTGALVVKKTGLTTNGTTGIASFSDGTLVAASSYRVVWRLTADGAEGLETLTAA